MTTDQIRFFLALATQLNFRAVAERFFITQPTLSRQIASLEAELRVKLFERSSKGVTLTPAGETFQKGISQVYRDMQEIIHQTRKTATWQDTSLTVAVQDDQCLNGAISLALELFREQYPEVRIMFNRVQANDLYEGLLKGEYDVISMIDVDGQYLRGMEYEVLSEDPTCLAMQRSLARAYPDGISPREVEELTQRVPLNLLSPDHFANGYEPNQALVQNIGLRLEFTEYEWDAEPSSMALCIANGLCVSVTNQSSMLGMDPGITLVPIKGGAPIRTLMMSNPLRMSEQARAFWEIFCSLRQKTVL